MSNIDQLYERLGLTPLQADIILAIMENGGSATVPQIIEILSVTQKVNRTSIYSVLKKLDRMNLVLSSEQADSRNISYSLASNSPDEIIKLLIEPQQQAIEDFSKKLQEARIVASRSQIDTDFYSLKKKDQIEGQVRAIINESKEYLLIMANSLMLQALYPMVEEKKKEFADLDILIQPTWNTDQTMDLDALLNQYKELLGKEAVAEPLHIFPKTIEYSLPLFSKYEEKATAQQLDMMQIIRTTHFVQILSENGMVMSTYFDHDVLLSQGGTGIYSREQFISQNYIIIYFSIFQSHQPDFDDTIMQRIITSRMSNWFETIMKMLSTPQMTQ